MDGIAAGFAGAVQVFSASATRDSSPPEAILSSGLGSSPGFGEIRICDGVGAVLRPWRGIDLNHDPGFFHGERAEFDLDAFAPIGGLRSGAPRSAFAAADS